MKQKYFNCYSYLKYKTLLKERLLFLKDKQLNLSWKTVADKIHIQSTYLSKALNYDKTHLSEEDVFKICQILNLNNDETDFVLLLRSENISQSKDRQEYLHKKINDIKKKRLVGVDKIELDAQLMSHEMDYLLDPLVVVIHVSLFISKFKNHPQSLCSYLSISVQKLKKSLTVLDRCGYITYKSETMTVESVNDVSLHFGKEHPLTRIHQMALKSMLLTRLGQTQEDKKESFIATFTMEEKNFERIKDDYAEFIKKVKSYTESSKNDKTHKLYQINFDLLEWF